MTYQGKAYGFTAEQNKLQQSKYDAVMEKQVVNWINKVLGSNRLKSEGSADALKKSLENGVILCEFMNTLKPNSVKSKTMKQKVGRNIFDMQRIAAFNAGAKALGLPTHSTFEGGDLRDGNNMTAVLVGIYTLGRMTQKLSTAKGGIKAKANKGKQMQ